MEVRNIHLLLIRHGQTPGNREKRYIGCRTDEALSPEGEAQLLQLRGELPGKCPFPLNGTQVFCGPMLRCRQTAQLLFPENEVHIAPGFTEMDFGAFESRNYAQLNGDPAYQAWIDGGGTGAFPGGEDRAGFIARSLQALHMLLPQLGESNVLVCHGGNIMAVLSSLTGRDYFDFQLANGEGISLCLQLTGEEIHVLSYHRLCGGFSA